MASDVIKETLWRHVATTMATYKLIVWNGFSYRETLCPSNIRFLYRAIRDAARHCSDPGYWLCQLLSLERGLFDTMAANGSAPSRGSADDDVQVLCYNVLKTISNTLNTFFCATWWYQLFNWYNIWENGHLYMIVYIPIFEYINIIYATFKILMIGIRVTQYNIREEWANSYGQTNW